jgi:hypothetical protein
MNGQFVLPDGTSNIFLYCCDQRPTSSVTQNGFFSS